MLTAYGGSSRSLEDCAKFGLRESVTVQATAPLFARIDFKNIAPEIEKIRAEQMALYAKETGATEPQTKVNADMGTPSEEKEEEKTPEISFDDFVKVELKVGEIIACEAVPKSSKLLKETVKFGNETRTIVSGNAKHFKPEEMVG